MTKYLMALDQGTTSSRCILFDRDGNVAAKAQKEFRQYFPQDGWVEHDAEEIWSSQLAVAREAMEQIGITADSVAAIGITNQRETVVVWDRKTGKPVCHAIVWQCRRTADFCETLKKNGMEKEIRERTGLLIDPYFSASKLRWILDRVDGARERAERGELLFGTVDCWLIYNLTGGRVHATDPSNAARTQLFNIHTMQWDEELLKLFGVPACMMPDVLPSSGVFGETDPALFGKPIPIAGVAGDQQAALFGQCCFEAGDAKNTYGTGGFLLMNTGDKPVLPGQGLLATVGWKIGDEVRYVAEGSVFVCGAVIQWLRDGMKILDSAAESEECANRVPDTAGVYLVPAFVGLGAPYWDAYARGTLIGLTRATGRDHVVRAALESMAYQITDVLDTMKRETGLRLSALRVDGGASANNFLMQFQSDLLGLPLIRPASVETTAWGAATLAGLGTGIYGSKNELSAIRRVGREFTPLMDREKSEELLRNWHRAVERSMHWCE